ncbi:MAG: TonB-dependent receptor [Acidobacteriota bacterium]
MKLRIAGVALLVLALAVSGAVFAQGNTGALSGRVLDQDGNPIPGASIEVTSKFLQGPRGTASNVQGEFLIPYLPPANDYRMVVEAVGFNKIIQSNVTISLGSTTTLEVTLMSGGEEVTVTARPPAVTLKETKISTNLTQEEMEMIPIGRQYQDTLYLAPTVVSSGSGGNPGVAGSTSSENIFLVNGLNTTDPVTGTFGTNLNFNFIREMEVATGGLDAEYGASTGGLFNVLTKSGSNEFHGEVFAYYTDDSFTANAHSTDLSVNSPQPYHNYDYGFDVGGPIVKDKLWFFVAYNPSLFTRHHEGVSVLTAVNPYHPAYGSTLDIPYKYDDLSRNWFWSTKFNYRVNEKHNLELSIFSDPSHMWYNEGYTDTLDRRSYMTRRYQGGYSAAFKWYATWSSNFFMDFGIGKTHSRLDILPWDKAGYGRPQIVSFDYSPSLSIGGGIGNYIFDDRDTDQYQVKMTYLYKNHEIKFGGDYEVLKWDSYSNYTGGRLWYVQYNLANLNPATANPADYYYWIFQSVQNPNYNEKGYYTALFAQDKWSVTDNVTLSYGLRYEKNEIKPGNGGQQLSLDSWSPRLGISYDFMKNGRSKMFLNLGRFYQRLPIALANSMDPGHATYQDVYRGYPKSFWYRNTYGAIPTTILDGVKNQYTDELVAGLEYEIKPDLTFGFRGVFRELGRVIEDVGYIDAHGGISYIVMNPGDQWPAGIMDAWASAVPDYERFPKPIRNYQGYTFTLNKRFSDNWFLNASYTLSFLRGNYEGGSGGYSLAGLNPGASSAYDIPESILINNRYGWLPQDRRHQLKIQGSYRFDFGMVLGANFIYQSGRPFNKQMGYPNYEAGYGTVLVAERGSDRLPGTWQLDLHAEYTFKLWKTNLALFADVFNATNRQTATAKYQTYYQTPDYLSDITSGNLRRDTNWGKTSARQGSRNARLGVKWTF